MLLLRIALFAEFDGSFKSILNLGLDLDFEYPGTNYPQHGL